MKNVFVRAYNRFKSAPKYIRVCTYILMSYAAYAGLVGLVFPAVIQSQGPKQLTQMLGREVAIAEVKINPFLLRVEVNDFAISAREKSDRFVSIKQLKTEFNFWQSISNLTPTLEHLTIQYPYISLARLSSDGDKTTFNFNDIIEKLDENKSTDANESEINTAQDVQQVPEKLFAFKAHVISLNNGQVDFEDKPTGVELGYQNINFSLSELDTTALTLTAPSGTDTNKKTEPLNKTANVYTFGMNGLDKSHIQTKGQFQLQPLEVTGELSLAKLQLAPLWPFTENRIEAELASGEVSFAANYHLKQQNEQLGFVANQGQFSLADVAFEINQNPQIKLPSLDLTGISLDTTSQVVELEKLLLVGLWVDADLSKKGLDLQQHFTPKSEPNQAVVKENSPAQQTQVEGNVDAASLENSNKEWLVQLHAFDMQKMDINLKEGLISNGVHWRVYPLNISLGPITSELSDPIDYKFDFGIASDTKKQPERVRGTFNSQGKLDIKAEELNSQLQLSGLELTQFQPYLDPHLNIILSQGNLSTKGGLTANSRGKAIFNGQLTIDQLLLKDILQKEPLLKWKQMSIDSLMFDQADNRLDIKTILLNTPYAKVIVAKDLRTNIGAVSKSSPETTSTAEEESGASTSKPNKTNQAAVVNKTSESGSDFQMDIEKIQIVNGSAFLLTFR
ncbi:DUF748 domain-containing protein [Vibrio sp. kj40-1]|uniref:DUF748 domain-containing protein n=1 Tax=Vibrio algarum TaxID=3020714 RepID=A0ABT4YRC8_9VIBR|nr:DUF748 domain-containing protein [Vibrio sp. KJ40-1]MDB1124096.1 DUF748 domain-containing protein [Vibrio sp. KJ40-1]